MRKDGYERDRVSLASRQTLENRSDLTQWRLITSYLSHESFCWLDLVPVLLNGLHVQYKVVERYALRMHRMLVWPPHWQHAPWKVLREQLQADFLHPEVIDKVGQHLLDRGVSIDLQLRPWGPAVVLEHLSLLLPPSWGITSWSPGRPNGAVAWSDGQQVPPMATENDALRFKPVENEVKFTKK